MLNDANVFEYWLNEYERAFNVRPAMRAITGGPASALQLDFTHCGSPWRDTVGQSSYFTQEQPLIEGVRALGFDWTSDARVFVVPTPDTFNALIDERYGKHIGLRTKYFPQNANLIALGPWLDSYLHGFVPIHVADQAFYASLKSSEDIQAMRWHFNTILHDLSVHALSGHLVPRACFEAMRRIVVSALGAQVDTWKQLDSRGSAALAYFFDHDFNTYCFETWFRCGRPDDFPKVFCRKANFSQLCEALVMRIEEHREGRTSDYSNDPKDEQQYTFKLSSS